MGGEYQNLFRRRRTLFVGSELHGHIKEGLMMAYFCNQKSGVGSYSSTKKAGCVWTPLFVCFLAVVWSWASYADFSYSNFPDAGNGAITGMTLNDSTHP